MIYALNQNESFPSGPSIPHFAADTDSSASQVLVMGPDDYIVAVVR